ncbi:universal stress protein [Streptomyces sp. NPDC088387]|uniref:universal stress protein n=1 Tax=Streptomyces sp. NPDC088387 TaxID=3365859 RepID=UPI00380B4A82
MDGPAAGLVTRPVVVGVDGSQPCMTAVEAAAREADRLGVGLRLAHALQWSSANVPPGVPPWDRGAPGACEVVKGALEEAERRARRAAPRVRVTHEVLMGDPATVLASASRNASLTVVGGRTPARRHGGGRRGSVAGRLAAHGCSPVLVVRGSPDPAGPVVLVADGDTAVARAAAEFAFAEASARGAEVAVLDGTRERNASPADGFTDLLTSLEKKHPDTAVRHVHIPGGLRRALVEAGAEAQLVVVPAHGPRGPLGALLHPVRRAALRHADCPVAVIRPVED